MCGIVGIASKHVIERRAWLNVGRDKMTHRGPDDAGEWWSNDGTVGLAHRRLSIVDLSPAGHQPMHSAEEDLSVVFNGEIYNFQELRAELEAVGHVFRSQGDTEVLLAAYQYWGVDCLTHLNGMFAFALYDRQRRILFVARDRAGEKPLFYHLGDRTLCFASELKALMANPLLPRIVNPVGLDCYLSMGFVPGDLCILDGYHKLPPAHFMLFDLQSGTAEIKRYWAPPAFDPNANASGSNGSLLEELEALLEDSVGRQMAADVPVGILLSGGVDSSLITAMAVRHSAEVKTFTIGFPGHGKQDEIEHARLIANHFGTEQVELMAEPGIADLLPKLAAQFDEPMVDSSMIPTFIVSQLVRQHCTVALGGDGGDELFGGYEHYSRMLTMRSLFGRIPHSIRSVTAAAAGRILPMGFKGRNWLNALDLNFANGLPLIGSYFGLLDRKKLLRGNLLSSGDAERIFLQRIPSESDFLQRATRMDFSDYLAEDILVKVDRSSMLSSLEVRAPFLDHRIIEFAYGKVPSYLKATTESKKIMLKQLAAKVLPPEFDRQRKQGFSIPLAEWLKEGPFRDLFWSVLTDPGCSFDRATVDGLLNGQDVGRSNSERLFALVQFELWRKEYGVSLK